MLQYNRAGIILISDMENVFQNDIFFRYINSKLGSDFIVSTIGFEKCSVNKEPIGPLVRGHYILHYILSGCGTLTVGSKTYNLTSDDIFCVPAMQKHYYSQDKKNPWTYIWFEFSGVYAKNLFERAFTAGSHVFHNGDEKIREDILSLYAFAEHNDTLELHAMAHLYKLLAALIDIHNRDNPKKPFIRQNKIKDVLSIIENQYSNPNLGLALISKTLYTNPSYLSKIFHEHVGITLTKYILQIRMQKACELLEKTSHSIKEIAFSIGYQDPLFFSKEFKKFYKVAPSMYKSVGKFSENS